MDKREFTVSIVGLSDDLQELLGQEFKLESAEPGWGVKFRFLHLNLITGKGESLYLQVRFEEAFYQAVRNALQGTPVRVLSVQPSDFSNKAVTITRLIIELNDSPEGPTPAPMAQTTPE